MDEQIKGIGEKSILADWPEWLRWVLCIPIGFAAALTASILLDLVVVVPLSGFFDRDVTDLNAFMIFPAIFIYFCSWIAPGDPSESAKIFLFFFVMFLLPLSYKGESPDPVVMALLISAGVGVILSYLVRRDQ